MKAFWRRYYCGVAAVSTLLIIGFIVVHWNEAHAQGCMACVKDGSCWKASCVVGSLPDCCNLKANPNGHSWQSNCTTPENCAEELECRTHCPGHESSRVNLTTTNILMLKQSKELGTITSSGKIIIKASEKELKTEAKSADSIEQRAYARLLLEIKLLRNSTKAEKCK